LLERRADANACQTDDEAYTALLWATQNGNLGTVRLLLSHGVNVNVGRDMTALMCSSQNGHIAIVKALLEWKANVSTVSTDGSDALILAGDAKTHSCTLTVC
jgi:ankyrin repeat protein